MSEYYNVADIFGENVFNDAVMQERLPKKVYKKLHEVMDEGKEHELRGDCRHHGHHGQERVGATLSHQGGIKEHVK